MAQAKSESMMTQFFLPLHLFQRLDNAAQSEHRTRASMTREIVRRYFAQEDALNTPPER
jgi:predicted DNA-binding protein